MTPSRVLLRVPDIVAMTGFARTKVFELLASGEIPSFTEGRNRYVHVDAFDAYLRRRAGLDRGDD